MMDFHLSHKLETIVVNEVLYSMHMCHYKMLYANNKQGTNTGLTLPQRDLSVLLTTSCDRTRQQ